MTGIESRPFAWEYQYCHDALGFDVLSGANVTLHVTGSTLWILWCCKCDQKFCGSQTTVYSNREEPCGKCNKIIFPLPVAMSGCAMLYKSRFYSLSEYSLNGEAEHFALNSSPSQKLALWEGHKEVPMECWKANMVLAWLEVECGMPMYAQSVYENIKSGKALLELSDSDLSSGLAITKTMHRRKLRLAIEDYRQPSRVWVKLVTILLNCVATKMRENVAVCKT